MQLTPDVDASERVKSALIAAFGADYAERNVGLAISGGGDSMAMLHLMAGLMPNRNLFVLTVHHNLRPEALAEAALVEETCVDLGISCTTVDWHWDQTGNLQASARAGRWSAMRSFAVQKRLDAVAVGHTQDDQIENFFLRLARGSGVDGLAGMQPRTMRDDVMILRPLLSFERQELRDWLEARHLRWADDPSNEDPKYDRVKARRMLSQLNELGLTPKRVLQTVAHMKTASNALTAATIRFARRNCRTEFGDVIIELDKEALLDTETLHRCVAAALQWVGRQPYRPRFDALQSVLETVFGGQRATLHGCVLSHQNNCLRISRELNAVEAVKVGSGSTGVLWDDRWVLEGPSFPETYEVRAVGEDGIAYCLNWRQIGAPRPTLLTTPSVWSNGSLIAAPIAGYENGWTARIVADFEEWLVTH